MQRVGALDASQSVSDAPSPRVTAWQLLRRLSRLLAMDGGRAGSIKYSPPVVLYVAGTVLLAAICGLLTVRSAPDPFGIGVVACAIGLMAFFSVTGVSGVNTVFNASSFLHLGLALSVGPFGCLSGALTESLGINFRYKSGPFRTAFNLGNIFLSNLGSWAAYHALSELPVHAPVFWGVAGLSAGFVHWAVNHLLVSGIIRINSGRPFWRQVHEALPTLPYNLCYGYAAIAFVALHDRFSTVGFTFALAPVAALQVFLMVLSRRTRVHEEQRNDLLAKLQEESVRVERSYDATLIALTHALDARDKETEGHSRRVVEYTRLVAVRLGIEGEPLKLLCHGALLHDIGKIGVPDAILHKPGPLTEEEWQVMRRHPEVGALMVEEVEYLTEARRIILHHHERWDGRGYPLGLRGSQISLGARAFAIADTVDAITQDRPYRRGRSFDEAREELAKNRGTQFDPDAVDAFLGLSEAALLNIAAIRARVGIDLLAGKGAAAKPVLAGARS